MFRRFDLGNGVIEPVKAFKADHHTPLAGQALTDAKLEKAFAGLGGLRKCRISIS